MASDRCKNIMCVMSFVSVGILLVGLLIYTIVSFPNDPTFSVESTAVKAFNLTSDGKLFCIINVGVRVHNADKNSYDFDELFAKVKKPGKHGTLAEDKLVKVSLRDGDEALFYVEAVGFGSVALKGKVAEEARADVAAGEGWVDVVMEDSGDLNVLCKSVVVDFSKSTVRKQRVDCMVRNRRRESDFN